MRSERPPSVDPSPPGLVSFLAGLVVAGDECPTLVDAAGRVVELAVAHLGADHAGVQIGTSGRHLTRLARSDALLDGLGLPEVPSQGTAGAPAGGALPSSRVVAVSDTTLPPWGAWGQEAARRGIGSGLLAGMPSIRNRPLLLELYFHAPGGSHVLPAEVVTHVAHLAGLTLRSADRLGNLADAMISRGVIGQAQGLLMERYQISGTQAMAYLRRHSQATQVAVRDLAARLAAEHEPPTSPTAS